MKSEKIVLLIILVLLPATLYSGGSEISGFLENNWFKTRIIYRADNYSACFLTRKYIGNSGTDIDFSFDSSRIRAGRVKKKGVWRELSNPLGAYAGSDVYNENSVLDKNYDNSGTSLYGFSFGLKEKSSLNILVSDSLWIGTNLLVESDYFRMRGFASFIENKKDYNNKWISTRPVIPDTNPVHLGGQLAITINNLKLDYLGFLSGNRIYKSGFFNRLYIELIFEKLKLRAYAGYVSPDFIDSAINLAPDKYLFSFWTVAAPFKILQLELQSQYREKQLTIAPEVYIPCSGETSLGIRLKNSSYLLIIKPGQAFSFESNGDRELTNSLNIRTGVIGQVSLFLDFGISFDFELITERQFKAEARSSFGETDLLLLYGFREKRFDNSGGHILRAGFEQRIGSGVIFLKLEIGDGRDIANLSAGYRAVFN